MLLIAPSILSADFSCLGREVEEVQAAGADWIHFDVMDGCFVPNISMGLPVLSSLRAVTDLFLDVHLMIDRPLRYARRFCEAGADLVNFHVEADSRENLLVKALGKKTGITLKPGTEAAAAAPYLPLVDLVLVMTVEPGFGGQRFMEEQLPKIAALREQIEKQNPACRLEVDGGIDRSTAPLVKPAGADGRVAGSAVFKAADRREAIRALRG